LVYPGGVRGWVRKDAEALKEVEKLDYKLEGKEGEG
jgi:hypothetical protein